MQILKCIFGALALLSLTVFAQPVTLWEFENVSIASRQTTSIDVPKHAVVAARLSLNPRSLPNLAVDTLVALKVPMYSDPLMLSVKNIRSEFNQSIINAGEGEQRLVITTDGDSTFATVITERGVWSIRGKGSYGIMYQTHDPFHHHHHQQPQLKDDYLIPPEQPTKTPKHQQPSARQQAHASSNEIAVVDTYIIYNQAVENMYGATGALTRINHLIAVTNDIFANSNVHMRVNPLRIDKVNYPQSADSSQALRHATGVAGHTGVLTEARQMRDAIGADAMIFFRPFVDDGTCGIAWLNSSFNSNFWMVSHTSIDCGEEVTAHELGHNMGLDHSRRQGDTGATFPFALGHGVDNNFATVMAYPWVFGSGTQRVFKFSSPDLLCNGLPCGVDREDPVNGADAVFALNQKRFDIANIAQRKASTGTLQVRSVGVSSVALQSSTGQSGVTPYDVNNLPLGEVVRLTAPATSANIPFAMWIGCDVVVARTCDVTIRGDVSVSVVYYDGALDFGTILGAPELSFESTGNAPWQPDFSRALTSIASLRSGTIADDQVSALTTTVVGPGKISFNWQVSSEQDYDFLGFYVDDVLITQISGSRPWRAVEYQLGTGVHKLEWRYAKDFSVSEGSDAGWLDAVSWQPIIQLYSVNISKSGNGFGTVTEPALDFSCDAECTEESFTVTEGTSITLTAQAAVGSNFIGWSGVCSGISPCSFTPQHDVSVVAQFVLQQVNVTASVATAGGQVQKVSDIHFYGEPILFNLIPDAGFKVVRKVQGTCPVGTWLSATQYQTGPITAECTISFDFAEQNRRKLPFWLFLTNP